MASIVRYLTFISPPQWFPSDTGSSSTFTAPLALSAIPLEVEHVDEPAEGVPLNQLPQVVTAIVVYYTPTHTRTYTHAYTHTHARTHTRIHAHTY